MDQTSSSMNTITMLNKIADIYGNAHKAQDFNKEIQKIDAILAQATDEQKQLLQHLCVCNENN